LALPSHNRRICSFYFSPTQLWLWKYTRLVGEFFLESETRIIRPKRAAMINGDVLLCLAFGHLSSEAWSESNWQ
ncbi:hypothetical protein U1Q18_051923, partial [Sarracenia purpurea var. burkii]